jgi:hypothetical protein
MTWNSTHIGQAATVVIPVPFHAEPGAYLDVHDTAEARRTGVSLQLDGLAGVQDERS